MNSIFLSWTPVWAHSCFFLSQTKMNVRECVATQQPCCYAFVDLIFYHVLVHLCHFRWSSCCLMRSMQDLLMSAKEEKPPSWACHYRRCAPQRSRAFLISLKCVRNTLINNRPNPCQQPYSNVSKHRHAIFFNFFFKSDTWWHFWSKLLHDKFVDAVSSL